MHLLNFLLCRFSEWNYRTRRIVVGVLARVCVCIVWSIVVFLCVYLPELGIQGDRIINSFSVVSSPQPISLSTLYSHSHTHTLSHSLYRRIPHLPLRAMIGNMSKRSAVIAVMLAVALSLVFLFSVSSFHLSPSSYTGLDRASSPLSTKTTTKEFEPKYGCLANTASNITLSKEQWEQCIEPGQEASLYLSIVIVTRIDDYAG